MTPARRLREVEANQQAGETPAVGIGHEDAAEARRVEHRGDPHEPGADLDSLPLRVDRVGLHARGPGGLGSPDDCVQQRLRDAAAAVAGPDLGAADRPDGQVVDGRNVRECISRGVSLRTLTTQPTGTAPR